MSRRALLALCSALALTCLSPRSSTAQHTAAKASRTLAVAAATPPPRDGPEIPDLEAEPVLVVNGAPRSFQVVRVPVPAQFAADRPVSYDIVATTHRSSESEAAAWPVVAAATAASY
jgi:hypothetical protein